MWGNRNNVLFLFNGCFTSEALYQKELGTEFPFVVLHGCVSSRRSGYSEDISYFSYSIKGRDC
jgi:hypothetical protein